MSVKEKQESICYGPYMSFTAQFLAFGLVEVTDLFMYLLKI